MIPQSFIDDLLNRCDLVELIDGYVPLKKRGNSYIACCPFHNEKTPSFNVNAKKQFYHCFGCGASGNAISFIMQYLNQNFIETIETLATKLGMQVPSEKSQDSIDHTQSLYQTLDKVNEFYQKTLKQHPEAINYLKKRGLDGIITKKYQLGYAPQEWHLLEKHFARYKKELIASGMLIQKDAGSTYDRYRQRIMFPIHDRRGRIIGFGGRSIDSEQQPKYLNSPETVLFQKNRELYGLYQVLQAEKKPEYIIVVEGYLDVIALAQHGIHQAVATLGTATSTYHIQILSKHTHKIIFCFDGDKAGQEAAWRALENSLTLLSDNLEIGFIFLPEEQDPDSFIRNAGKEQFLQQVNQCQALSEFLLNKLSEGINLQQLTGKNQFMFAIKPYLQRIPNGAFRELLLNELSRLTHIENHRLEEITQTHTEKEINIAPTNLINGIQRTPTRLVIAILLQHPEIYQQHQELINDIQLEGIEQDIIIQLINKIAQTPNVTTAVLIESWRENPLFAVLNKLAYWDHQIPKELLHREFIDILHFLQKQNLEKKIAWYIAKSRKEGLTDTERLFLQTLLKERHQET